MAFILVLQNETTELWLLLQEGMLNRTRKMQKSYIQVLGVFTSAGPVGEKNVSY